MKAYLTIKNYRCFVRPTRVQITNGYTAFVGINNVGKSTLMRFLLEMRPILSRVSPQSGHFVNSIRNVDNFQPLHVLDAEEIFSNLNAKGLSFVIDFSYEQEEASPLLPERVEFTVTRDLYWHTQIFLANGPIDCSGFNNVAMADGVLRNLGDVKCNLAPLFDVMSKLSATLYIGPFRNTINVGTKSDYLDIEIGEAFIQKFRSLKTGPSKRNSSAMNRLIQDVQRIFEFSEFNVEASEDAKSLHVTVNGRPYKQHELGSGLSQFILVLVNASITSPRLILIDEPELNLHPSLQVDFLTTLGSYAAGGVWFSTHNMGLARSVAENIYSVRRHGDGDSAVHLLEGTPRLSEFLGELNFSAHRELGFEKILLVEGPTEVKVVQRILRGLAKDHKILILPLCGRITGEMGDELGEIARITSSISALIDSEKNGADEPLAQGRQAFVELCQNMKIECHVLELSATENYFSDAAVKEVFGESFRALKPFEKLNSITPRWSKAENWKLVDATGLDAILDTDFGRFLKAL